MDSWAQRDRAMGAAVAAVDNQLGVYDPAKYTHKHVTTAFMQGYTEGPVMPQPPVPNGPPGTFIPGPETTRRADIYDPETPGFCLNCGKAILMMCQRGTGYCSAQCKKDHTGEDTHEPYIGRNRAPSITD